LRREKKEKKKGGGIVDSLARPEERGRSMGRVLPTSKKKEKQVNYRKKKKGAFQIIYCTGEKKSLW